MRVWRIAKRKYAQKAFSGEGTQKVGGRWSPRGVKAVYTSSSLALAALELLVHLDKEDIATGFVAISADIPEDLPIEVITPSQLPESWRDTPAPDSLSLMGGDWLSASKTAVLSVPSAVISVERNFLLNPEHPDFGRIQIEQPEAFNFDSRLHDLA
jgi:RES domain-containing protein